MTQKIRFNSIMKGIALVGAVAALAVVVLLLTGSQNGEAVTITVDDDGGANYTNIQDAIDAAEDGDTIRVYEGIYEENVVVNKNINLIWNGSGETIIQGFEKEDGEGNSINCSYKGGFGGFYYGVVYDGKFLYAAHYQGLSIFNVSDPSDPEEIGFIHTKGDAREVTVDGDYAYIADGYKLKGEKI